MSRSASSVRSSPGPALRRMTPRSFILILGVAVLVIQLVDSFGRRHERLHPWPHHRGHGLPWPSPDDGISDDYKKSSGLTLKSPQLLVKISDKEHRIKKMGYKSAEDVVEKAFGNGLLLPPDELKPKTENNEGEDSVYRILGRGSGTADMYKPQIPEDCEDELICQEDMSYPETAMREIGKSLKDLRVLARVDEPPEVTDRIFDKDSDNLCGSTEATWLPKSVRKNKRDDWHRVVNVDTFEQGINVAHCLNTDTECSKIISVMTTGHSTACKQQYSLRPVVVINPHNGTVMTNLFPIPSGCCCHKMKLGKAARLSRNSYPQSWLGNGRDKDRK